MISRLIGGAILAAGITFLTYSPAQAPGLHLPAGCVASATMGAAMTVPTTGNINPCAVLGASQVEAR